MTKNWPDRIKVALFALILAPFIALILFLLLAFTGIFTILSMNQGFVIIVVIAVIFDIFYVVMKWKKLKQNELAGNMPDMTNQNNIGLSQTITALVGTVLLTVAYINYKLYSVTTAKMLFLACITIVIIETIYRRIVRKNKP